MRSMGDSAWPPGAYPAVDAWAFYVGGDTPHTWTDREVAAVPCRYRLPIFTRNVGGDPVVDAAHTIAWCRAHGQPRGTLTALDFEDRVDPAYLRAYDQAVHAAGWLVVVYGQQGTVLDNPRPSGGYWVANWDQDPDPARLMSGWAARQYAADTQLGHPWDLSVLSDTAPLWDTRPPTPAPSPAPAPQPQETLAMEFIAQVAPNPNPPNDQPGIWLWNDGKYSHIATPADLGAFASLGIKSIDISYASHQGLLATQTAGKVTGTVPMTISGSGNVTFGP